MRHLKIRHPSNLVHLMRLTFEGTRSANMSLFFILEPWQQRRVLVVYADNTTVLHCTSWPSILPVSLSSELVASSSQNMARQQASSLKNCLAAVMLRLNCGRRTCMASAHRAPPVHANGAFRPDIYSCWAERTYGSSRNEFFVCGSGFGVGSYGDMIWDVALIC